MGGWLAARLAGRRAPIPASSGEPSSPERPQPGRAFVPPPERPTAGPAAVPLRLAPRRFWLWASALAAMSAIAIVGAPGGGYVDFPQFWSAGRTVGTPDLVEAARHAAWQLANGVRPGFFAYPPGAAWLFAPIAALPLVTAFWSQAALMAGLAALAGVVGARVYGLDRRVGLVAALAWAPTLGAAAVGQNSPLALLLSLLAIAALVRGRDGLAGVWIGVLLYKPTLALPLLGLCLVRRRWRAAAAVAAAGLVWYALSVAAAAGDWQWPAHWLAGFGGYYCTDTAGNANKTISLPGLLLAWGVPPAVAWIAGVAVVVAALPRLVRAPIAEAAAGACLVGLAVSPHALNYDAALVLPFLLWAAGAGGGIREPWRTRLVVGAYLAAPLYLLSPVVGVSCLAVLTLGSAAIWISGWRAASATPAVASRPLNAGRPAG